MIKTIDTYLFLKVPEENPNSTLLRIASCFCYVYENCLIGQLSQIWRKYPDLEAIGVLDNSNKAVGILVQEQLFKLLGNPYGWDVMSRKMSGNYKIITRSFLDADSIYYAAEQLKGEIKEGKQKYYLIIDGEGSFQGIFSIRDVLVTLSEKNRNDIRHAQEIQRNIIESMKKYDGRNIEIVCINEMALEVGGDIHYCKKYSESSWIIFLSDVCGKGIAAALVTSVLRGMAEVYDFNQGFEKFIEVSGDYLARMNEFATAVFLDYDEESGKLNIADMGHSYIYRYNGVMEKILPAKNPPLGIDSSGAIKTYTIDSPGFIAVMTDGIIEQVDSSGREYPLSRFEEYLSNHNNESIETLGGFFLSDIREYRGNVPQNDDITFILMRFKRS